MESQKVKSSPEKMYYAFHLFIMQNVTKIDPKNVAIAPFGVALSLGMAASAATGNSDAIIRDALGLHDYEMRRRAAVRAVIDALNVSFCHLPSKILPVLRNNSMKKKKKNQKICIISGSRTDATAGG